MKIKRELWFGLILMSVILLTTIIFMPWTNMTQGHLGLLMLSLVEVADADHGVQNAHAVFLGLLELGNLPAELAQFESP